MKRSAGSRFPIYDTIGLQALMYSARWLNLAAGTSLLLLWASVLYARVSSCPTTPPETPPPPAGMFDLELAKRYEKQLRWKEAEQEYLQAGRIGSPSVKKEVLAAIERLSIHRPSDDESFESELGKFYEDEKDWKDAEQHYAAASKDAARPLRDRALRDVARVHAHMYLQECVEDFDRWLGYLARLLGVLFLLVLVARIWKTRRGIQVAPFEVSTDEGAKRLVFALSAAREGLPGVLAPVLATTPGNVVDSLPLIILPGVENAFPDPAEDLEVGEVKLPLAAWIRIINLPAIRVSGRWQVGETMGASQARIQRRTFPLKYADSRLAFASIDSQPSDLQDWLAVAPFRV
jgi:hypothetical protein